jgi:hypothetical protein
MAARKTSFKKSPETDPKDYVQIKLPSFLPKISWPSLAFIAILLLLGGLVGYQTAKVTYWEQKETALSAGSLGQIPTPTPGIFKVGNGHLPVLGKSDAKVTIVEFSDLQCLFCRKFWKDTLPQIKKDYIDTGFTLVFLILTIYPSSTFSTLALPVISATGAKFFGLRTSKSSSTRGRPWVTSDITTPPKCLTRMVS